MTIYLYLGTDGDDTVNSGSSTDIVSADGGDDTVNTGSGRDYIRGGSGDDKLKGGSGNDLIRGDSGDDTIIAGTGKDVILGDEGDDDIYGGGGGDLISGGTGDDTLTGGGGSDIFLFSANAGNDTITDFDVDEDMIDLSLLGTTIAFDDLTIADLPDDSGVTVTHTALGGTITLTGVSASELTADHFNLPSATSVNTDDGDAVVNASDPWEGTDGRDFFIDSSADTTILLKDGNDLVLAGEGDDTIDGGAGKDWIIGEEGDDTIHGGAGNDWMHGGSGDDTFVFKAGHGNDTIRDFTDGEDTIRIDTNGLTGVTGFADLSIAADGNNAVIDLSSQGGGKITLVGVDTDDLDANDFAFYDSSTDADAF